MALGRVAARRRRPLRGRARAAAPRAAAPRVRARSARASTTLVSADARARPLRPARPGPARHRQDLPRRAHDRRRAARPAGASASRRPSHAAIQNLLREVETCAHEQGVSVRRHLQGRRTTRARTASSSRPTDNDDVTDDHQLVGRHGLAVRPPRAPRGVRPPLHRRGRPVRARQRRRRRRSPRRAWCCSAIPSSCRRSPRPSTPTAPAHRCSSTCSTARARSAPDRGVLLDRELAHAPRRLRVRLRAQLRRAAALARTRAPLAGSTHRPARSPARGCARSRSSTRAAARRAPRRPTRSPPPAATCSPAPPSPTTRARPGRSSPATSSSSRPTTSPSACIRDRVPAGVRVGTVDRFQGQQAPVVFYAMTCSAGEDVPRGLDFLFDAHRLNVAVSRAAVPRRARPQPAAARRRLPHASRRWSWSTASAASSS